MTERPAPARERAAGTTIGDGATLFDTTLHAQSADVSAAKAKRFGSWYVAEYYLRSMRRYGDVILADAVGSPLMYILAMGIGLGSLLTGNGTLFDGVPYLVFIAPALLVSGAVQGATSESTFPVMDGFKWHRIYQGPLVTPISPAQIFQGQALAILIRLLIQSALFMVIVVLFGAVSSPWAPLAILIAALSGMAFGLPIMAYSATIREEKGQFSIIMRFVFMPLFLFSGTFYPLSNLPLFLQWIGWISPIWHGTELARLSMYGHHIDGWLIAAHLAFLLALGAVGFLLGRRIFNNRLRGIK